MTEVITEKKIIAKECKFAIHLPNKDPSSPDRHFVKERVYYEDGTSEPRITYINNYQRPFWLTKPKFRNFEQKKEYQEIEKLDMYKCTQSRLESTLARALGRPGSKERLKQLCSSPYVYGADIPSETFIKRKYQKTWNKTSENTLCALDIETDVLHGTELPIMVGAVMADKACISVVEGFVEGFDQVEQRLALLKDKYIEEVLATLNPQGDDDESKSRRKNNREVIEFVKNTKCEVEFIVVKDAAQAIIETMKRVHKWMPDFLAIWNMNFDIPKILACLAEFNIDPADVFCDPSIPKEIRLCKYKEGNTKKVTASGKVQPISPADQWHTFFLSASFYVLDAMCTYRLIRLGGQELPRYSLDFVLNKELGASKLKLTDGDEHEGLKWHQVMQEKHKLFYCIYNFFDSYMMILLDKKTKDIAFTFTAMVECTSFENFKRQPLRIVTSLFFYLLEKEEGGKFVLASMGMKEDAADNGIGEYDGDDSDVEAEEEDDEDGLNAFGGDVLSLSGWVITLPAHMAALGLNAVKESKSIRTMLRAFVYDSDATSAYPSATEVANLSKVNTKCEIIAIEGIDEEIFRTCNMNMVTGPVNAMEYTIKMFNAPNPFDILDMV